MELNKEQINLLYQFTKKHGVVWYDLQSELVDHLANDMEIILQKQPNTTFNIAKQITFNKFSKTDFEKVINAKRKSLKKRYNKLFWNEFKNFFTFPKITVTIGLIITIVLLINISNHNVIFLISTPLITLAVFLFFAFENYNEVKRKEKKYSKKFMYEDYMANLGNFAVFLNTPFQILATYIIITDYSWDLQMKLIYSTTIITMALVYYILSILLPPEIRAIIAKEHPEYQIS